MRAQLAVLGECMIEIKPDKARGKFEGATINAGIRYGGDTLNCSIYLARMGVDVAYVTALGDDPMSDWMVNQWREEGVACDLVNRVENATTGLYLIDIDDVGERSFYYWREQSPARRIFDDEHQAQALFSKLKTFRWIYLSGITLALYEESVRQRLYTFLDNFRAGGGKVCFDNNYRPRQWREAQQARDAFKQLYQRCDIALPTLDDEQLLFPNDSERDIVNRIRACGVPELVLKKGAKGCLVVTDNIDEYVPATPVDVVIDSTAAGDSFNAAYLAARFDGLDYKTAARQGHVLAGQVVQHPGAIIEKAQMPTFN